MQFFSIKETSEYEEDPNVQQLPLLQLLLLAMSTTTSPAKQLYSRNLLLSEHKEFSQPTEFFKDIYQAHNLQVSCKTHLLEFVVVVLRLCEAHLKRGCGDISLIGLPAFLSLACIFVYRILQQSAASTRHLQKASYYVG
jgi:hypothetical protein